MKTKSTCLLFLLLLNSICTFSQEEFVEPESHLLTKIPFVMLNGGIILLQAKFNQYPDTLNFIFDTGSSGISLDSSTAVYLKLKPQPTDRTIRGIGGIKKVPFLYHNTLQLPGIKADSLDFHVNDYSLLSSIYGISIDGIIGYSFINRYIFSIDYDSLIMSIFSRGPFRYPKGGYLLNPNLSTLLIQEARIVDAKKLNSKFLYDIGAGVCLLLSKDFIADSSFLLSKRKLYVKDAEGIGGRVEMYITIIKEIKLGPFKFKNVPTYIFDDVTNITNYPYLSGILGNDLLRHFNCIINYSKKEIFIKPNTHYLESFDYAYSGVEIYFINGEILVGSVAKNSPAEECGLQVGDQVISIGNYINLNLNLYKFALQQTGEKIRIIIKRNNEFKVIYLKNKSLI